MANPAKFQGLVPVRTMSGSKWQASGNTYSIAYNYGTSLAIGDPVVSTGTSDVNGVPGVQLWSSGAIRGVIAGIGRQPGSMSNPFNQYSTVFPAGGDGSTAPWYVTVIDSPDVLFSIRENLNGTALDATKMGLNTTLISAANNGYLSQFKLASYSDATPATTATLPVKLFGLMRKSGNAFGPYAEWLIQINNHELGHGTGSVGV